MSTNADLRSKFHDAVSQGSKAPWVDTPPAAPFGRSARIPLPTGILGGGPSAAVPGAPHQHPSVGFQPLPLGFPQAQPQPQQYLAPPQATMTNVELSQNATPAPSDASSSSKNSRLYMYIVGFVIVLVLIGLAYWGYKKWCDSKKVSVITQGGGGNYRDHPGGMGAGQVGIMKQPPQLSPPPMVTQYRDMAGGPGGQGGPGGLGGQGGPANHGSSWAPAPTVPQPPQPEDNDPNFTPLSQAGSS